MRILIACEYSGIVREAFAKKGHDAWSCDILPTEIPGNHIQGDVIELIDQQLRHKDSIGTFRWDLMIAHPPCTYLCNSGVSWLHKTKGRWDKMIKGAKFFKRLLEAPIEKIVIENPVMHKYAKEIIGKKQDQTIQPWQYGEDASKRTCLWFKNVPNLKPTNIIIKDKYANQTPSGRCNLPPSKDRGKIRSRTYVGIANAMADQWG